MPKTRDEIEREFDGIWVGLSGIDGTARMRRQVEDLKAAVLEALEDCTCDRQHQRNAEAVEAAEACAPAIERPCFLKGPGDVSSCDGPGADEPECHEYGWHWCLHGGASPHLAEHRGEGEQCDDGE